MNFGKNIKRYNVVKDIMSFGYKCGNCVDFVQNIQCDYPRSSLNSNYCPEHVCNATNCKLKREGGSNYCTSHNYPTCKFLVTGRYNEVYKTCNNPTPSVFNSSCYGHECKYPYERCHEPRYSIDYITSEYCYRHKNIIDEHKKELNKIRNYRPKLLL